MHFPNRRMLIAAMSLSFIPSAGSQPVIPETSLAIFDAPPSTHRLDRFFVTGNGGRRYQVFRALPTGVPPAGGFPVLYMLDGNGAFDSLTQALLQSMPQLAVIGIGYDTTLRYAVEERSLDYTPPEGSDGPTPDPDRPGRMIGGAPDFLDFLTGDLRRAAERGIAVDPSRRFIWGHSYGGLFALFALFAQPSAFHGYAAISPSVWRSAGALRRRLDDVRWPDGPRLRLLVALGVSERRSGGAPLGPAANTMALVDRLDEVPSLAMQVEVLKGLGHGATFAASLPTTLDWIKGEGP
ncbi:alpha/beta hydrolase-fold protein [Chelativorans sp. AA-79]|uniref:alpha/beta hydrolase n=1 Tax=Chelativorans sp. AA-79 TaxID=3028735 RepID=UPI0023F79563|nr:alpha/beta hydrolase-fold protein [Chelativorans sp. AA-79]WEX11036.1 alpha/beta hydrolase-fold protein [Chelativorans sp. AA-79]